MVDSEASKMCDMLEREDWKPEIKMGNLVGGFVSTLLAVGIGAQVLSTISTNLNEQGIV